MASHNPSGTAHVTDDEVRDALRDALDDADVDTRAVPSRAVSDRLSIKRPAVKKRLDKLAMEDAGVRRFKGAQAYLYYPSELGEDSQALQAATPPSAAAETVERAQRGYLTRMISWVVGESATETENWYDHPDTGLSTTPLPYFALRFAFGALAGGVAAFAFGGPALPVAMLVGTIVMVLEGVSWLLVARETNTE